MNRLVVLIVAMAACSTSAPTRDAGTGTVNLGDGEFYVRCAAVCVRPRDCAVAYSSGEVCPPGFLCSSAFRCAGDAGQ